MEKLWESGNIGRKKRGKSPQILFYKDGSKNGFPLHKIPSPILPLYKRGMKGDFIFPLYKREMQEGFLMV
ncbi:MAG TPA: hypothetical protein PK303_08705 [bacterium]|nr:hypothetical protein [bacterium]HOL35937.1 hypothetical protein [bacterium]HPP09180.1 hypothetical protein [bacterium]